MNSREWTLFLISKETGKEMPHWVAYTRERCRQELKYLKTQCGGKLPKGLKAIIRKTFDVRADWFVTSSSPEAKPTLLS